MTAANSASISCYVTDGVYQRGQNLRRNDVEAKRVVDLIFAHAEKSPDRTLGVIAFSIAQRDTIRLEWESAAANSRNLKPISTKTTPNRSSSRIWKWCRATSATRSFSAWAMLKTKRAN